MLFGYLGTIIVLMITFEGYVTRFGYPIRIANTANASSFLESGHHDGVFAKP